MTPDQILALKPKVLSQKQREFYFENGYILLEKFLPDHWLERLRAATEEMVDQSRRSRRPMPSGTSTSRTRRKPRACGAYPA